MLRSKRFAIRKTRENVKEPKKPSVMKWSQIRRRIDLCMREIILRFEMNLLNLHFFLTVQFIFVFEASTEVLSNWLKQNKTSWKQLHVVLSKNVRGVRYTWVCVGGCVCAHACLRWPGRPFIHPPWYFFPIEKSKIDHPSDFGRFVSGYVNSANLYHVNAVNPFHFVIWPFYYWLNTFTIRTLSFISFLFTTHV
jgi:hypothetical protein